MFFTRIFNLNLKPKVLSPEVKALRYRNLNYGKIAKNLIQVTIFGWLSSITSMQAQTANIWGNPTCAVDPTDRILKDNLRKTNATGYQELITKHKSQLAVCRSQDPIKSQALWLRLYAKDTKPEVLADVLDRIVNRGYNAIFVEVFYDGRILLPVSDNPTPWRSVTAEAVKAGKVTADYDLWAEVIRQGQARGLKVYGWSFTMNFGYSYSQVPDRSAVPAKNGRGETSISKSLFDPNSSAVADGQAFYLDPSEDDHLFIDPYNPQAKSDFSGAIAALVKRQPDGILFDYVRYANSKSLVSNVKDLWIYGESARKALLDSMPDLGTKQLMDIYLDAGKITPEAIALLQETQQKNLGIIQSRSKNTVLAAKVAEKMLWQLTVNHAYEGVLDFVNGAIAIVNSSNNSSNNLLASKSPNMTIGAVFFPNGNLQKSDSYDARMQPWDRFPRIMERHPMTYGLCEDGKCVANEVMAVIKASPQTKVCPVLAGIWGQPYRNHPSFEIQMQAIKAIAPQIDCVSHFVYGWIEPESDQERKAGL